MMNQRTNRMAAVLLTLLVGMGAAGTGLAVWARQAETESQTKAEEATKQRDEAMSFKAALTSQRDQAEATRQTTAQSLDRALAVAAEAKRAAQDARAALEFLQDRVFAAGRPKAWAGVFDKAVTLRQAVDAAEPEIAKVFADRPLAAAQVREVLGSSYLDQGEPALAVQQYKQALDLRQTAQGPNHTDTVACRNNLARAYRAADRTVEASALYNLNPN